MSDGGWTDLPPAGDYNTGGYTDLPWDPGQVDVTPMQTLPADPSSSDWSAGDYANLIGTIGKTFAYDWQAANGAPAGGPYATQPTTYHPPTPYSSSPPAGEAPPGFDWSQLTDFSTPYPWAIGIVSLAGIVILARSVSRR